MNWFSGKIDEAVKEIKNKNKKLMVFVHNNDDISEEILKDFESDKLSSCFDDIVGLQIVYKTQVADQFNQFYKINCVPSLYMIASNGSLLNTKAESFDLDSVYNWLIASTGKTDGDDKSNKNSIQNSAAGSSKLKEKQQERAIEMERDLGKEEIERRSHCKNLQALKEMQKEQDIKEKLKQDEIDKIESKNAAIRVKQLIEEDRKEKEYRRKMLEGNLSSDVNRISGTQIASSDEPIRTDETRIQVRMCSGQGGQMVKVFKSKDCMSVTVGDWLKSVVNEESSSANMSDLFRQQLLNAISGGYFIEQIRPPRRFSEEDADKSFQDLQLCPSAVLILRPKKALSLSSSPSLLSSVPNMVGTVVNTALFTIYWILNGIYSTGYNLVVGSNRNNNNNSSNVPRKDNQSGRKRPSLDGNQNNSGQGTSSANLTSSGKKKYARTIKQGSINRLSHMPDDSDEENARWNGNSTSQL